MINEGIKYRTAYRRIPLFRIGAESGADIDTGG